MQRNRGLKNIMENSIKIIENWQSRLQFTIVAVMFFPTFLSYLYTPERAKDLINTGLGWSVIVGMFILIYLIIEVMKMYSYSINKKWIAKWINYLLLGETASFLPLLFIGSFTKVTNTFFISLYKFLVGFSVYLLMFIPVAIFLLLVVNFMVDLNKK